MAESRLFYVPLEHIGMRYTVHMDRDIRAYLEAEGRGYCVIVPSTIVSPPPPEGQFLNSTFTSWFKAKQLAMIAELFDNDTIQDGDTIWFADLWFPGIESIAYMKYFTKKPNVKIKGFIHAGSFTDTDFVRDLERWAKSFEDMLFDISDTVFVASDFIKKDILKKRYIHESKLRVTGLPLDYKMLDVYKNDIPFKQKRNIVLFNGRNCDEKQPHLFKRLEEHFDSRGVEFINTQSHGFSKAQYYALLSNAKVVVSYALQENFGFAIQEAAYLGCFPVLPRRLVYPELYANEFLYDTFEDSVNLVRTALTDGEKFDLTKHKFYSNNEIFKAWFE